MTQNTTLEPKKMLALTALLEGCSVTDAAQAAEVDRSTLYRWMEEPAFLAALNRGKRDIQEALRLRLLNLGEQALGIAGESLNSGDVKTALAILKGLGLFSGTTIGSTDAKDIAIEQARHKEHQTIDAVYLGVPIA